MMPSKGATSCWKDRSAVRRCTLACCAATLVRAAATSASATLTLARVEATVAWAAPTFACPTSSGRALLIRLLTAHSSLQLDQHIPALLRHLGQGEGGAGL